MFAKSHKGLVPTGKRHDAWAKLFIQSFITNRDYFLRLSGKAAF